MGSLNGRSPVTVAVDAMGGDHAPAEIVLGAAEASRRGVGVVLVGPRDSVTAAMQSAGVDLPVVHAPQVIAMDEPLSTAYRRKESSMYVAMEMVNAGDAHAVVSAGNSAAIMALSQRAWGRLPGIDRAAFGGFLPGRTGPVFLLDIGANPTVKSENLVQFAVMGEVYVRLSAGVEDPRIGLLSNGSEDNKGTKEIKEANEAIRKLELNFIGNVEGNNVFEGGVDVVVCDGFAGNVLLKCAEGVAQEIFDLIRSELTRDLLSKVAAAAMMPAFTRIRRRIDYETYGGAPVLGVNEIMINCHGRSKAKALTNAIVMADRLAREHLNDRIREAMEQEGSDGGRRRRIARRLHLRHE